MGIDVVIEDARWQQVDLEGLAQRGAQAVLAHFALVSADYEISLLGCGDAHITELNGDFRDKPKPTNVLSWPSVELRAQGDGDIPSTPKKDAKNPLDTGEIELGDIAISYETCQRESREQNKAFDQHVLHLIVHGMLHLLGYDHVRDKDATLMETLETEILCKLGQPDPYV